MKMTLKNIKRFLYNLKKINYGRIFYVEFIKRTNGEKRKMVCRFNVKKDLKGVGLKFNPKKRDLISVYDMTKNEYRFINLREIRKLKLDRKIIKPI